MRIFTPARLVTAGVALLVVVLALWTLPSRDYIFLPDEAHPVAPLVEVKGGKDSTDGGGIYYVDVVVRKASLLERLLGGLHEGADLHPPSEVVPPGLDDSQHRQVGLEEMRQSKRIAAAVALRALGQKVGIRPAGALVYAVDPKLPASGVLRPTDVIVAVDGKPVRLRQDVFDAMKGRKPGSTVRFRIRRGAKELTLPVNTAAAVSEGRRRAVVGVFLEQATDIRLPRPVQIDTDNVGGPSAGLAFALDVMEELGRNVDGGRRIAATGELFLDGKVGPIGGVKQKTIGARQAGVDAFLVPAGDNAREARRYAKGLRIIPVKSFQQALQALATLRES